MPEKESLISAYNIYTNVLDVLDMMTDNVYLSVTDISKLFSCICEVCVVDASIINKILLQKHLIVRQNRSIYELAIQDNKQPLKFIPTSKASAYCKIKICSTYSFILWDYKFIFEIFNLNLNDITSNIDIQNFCTLIETHTRANLNVDTVNKRLKELQLILKYQNIYF